MEEIIKEALSKGVEMHVAGEFDLASQLYESVIKLQPNHADANHNMGLLKLDTGKDLESLPYLQTALLADTSIAQFWLSYIKALIKLDRRDEAARILELAKESEFQGEEFVELNQLLNTATESAPFSESETEVPSPPQDIINQLVNLYNHGQLEAAAEQAHKIIRQYPKDFMAWNILGAACKGLGKTDDAREAFTKVTDLNPGYADGFSNLGVTLKDQLKLEEAISAFKKALAINSDHNKAYNNMGNTLSEQGKLEEAIEAYKKAISIKPDYAEAYNNMGIALKDQGKLDEAIEAFNKAISIKPDYAEVYNNKGNSLDEQGKWEEAIEAYNKAISIKPDYADALNNMGRLHWLHRNFNKAFELLEWRWKSKQDVNIGAPLKNANPVWEGEENTQVFVWKEQGIGDEIMFSSTLNELSSISTNIIVECDKRLIPLYQRSFSKKIKFMDDRNNLMKNEYTNQIAIGSLLKYFRQNISDFEKASAGWLKADRRKSAVFRKRLQKQKNDKIIGISWFTKSTKAQSDRRNIPMELLANCLHQIPARYVNLQYGVTVEELSTINSNYGLNLNYIEEMDLYNDLDGLAALVSACDIVISIDNATVHLAGALGIDTRLLLPLKVDERWGVSSVDSYWYDSITLYRQETLADWNDPLQLLITDLKKIHF